MSAQVTVKSEATHARPSWGALARAGLITVVLAVAANLVARALLGAVLTIDPAFPPLGMGAIAFFTALGVGVGAFVFAVIARRSDHPNRVWRIVAVAALALSIIPNLALTANPAGAPFPGGSTAAFGALIVFHLVAGLIALFALPALAKTR